MPTTRHRRRSLLALGFLVPALMTLAACGSSSKPAAARPTTTARLQIVSPAANEVTGSNIDLKLDLIGARIVQQTSGPLSPTEGHIHVSVDGKLVSMAYGTEQPVTGLTPGSHLVQAEFVATDHAPFKNRVVAAVMFTVGP
ncbi:MAG TPA: DUF6130 family protein [Acidimicrobiales bacterium]|jgi:hypothetical protein|nr:DUF6130 family protein [Acidimicrobiales bacterium]